MTHTFRYLVDRDPVPGARVTLADADAHHLARVVRRRAGDRVEVITPNGDIWPAVVVTLDEVAVVELGAAPRRLARRAPLLVCVGLCEWGRLDTAVEKCTELGIARIAIFSGSRSRRVPAPSAWERRRERLGRVAEAASRQSGQGSPPKIEGLWALDRVCGELDGYRAIVLAPEASISLATGLAGARPDAPIALVIGPDAGLAPDEVAQLRAAGAEVCHLGDTILRVETAAIVATGITLAQTGNLERDHAVASTDGETNR